MLTVDRVTVEPEPLGYESDSLLVLILYCRAMLCISAAIAGMRGVCPSVCHVRELRQNE